MRGNIQNFSEHDKPGGKFAFGQKDFDITSTMWVQNSKIWMLIQLGLKKSMLHQVLICVWSKGLWQYKYYMTYMYVSAKL